ncbi:MAG: rhodanese-like domain-containing protein [Verrucomicrobiota bacterium]|nr:rhodanese-like domain-containing protein [Verrucomicrobiota bacterium]
MKYFLTVIATAMIGCETEDTSPNTPNQPAGNTSPVTDRANLTPPKHTKDSFKLIQGRIAKNEAILIDVREKSEWEDGHLESARFLPLSELEEGESNKSFAAKLAETLPKDIIVYCHCVSGGRVMPASAILQKLGYDARPLKAGYRDLLKAGFTKAP